MKAIITVLGTDRPGIIAEVSAKLYEHNINILDISQTILQNYFTMVMLVDLTGMKASYKEMTDVLNRTAETTGVNFVGGYSALVQKGATKADLRLINSIPEALAETTRVCSSVNIGSTRAGINMDAVKLMG